MHYAKLRAVLRRVFYVMIVVCVGCADMPASTANNSVSNSHNEISQKTITQNISKAEPIPFRLLRTESRKNLSFTQGFYLFAPNRLLESSGLYGKSFIQYYQLGRDKIHKRTTLPSDIFAEGLTYKAPYIYLLTWRERKILVLDTNFRVQKTLPFAKEGWGITHNAEGFIISTGSDSLYFYNKNFHLQKSLGVYYPENKQRISNLNELEYVNGFIFANIWQEDRIIKIDPQTGAVVGYLDLGALIDTYLARNSEEMQDAVLNGIAWDKDKQEMYLTGKYWPIIFVIKLL